MLKDRDKDHVTRVCDECGHEQRVIYWNLYKKKEHLCRYCSNRKNGHYRVGKFKSWNSGVRQGPKDVGNTYLNSGGYFEVWVGKHTLPNKAGGYYLEHQLMAELDLNRELVPGEIVHHIDGDKTNNSTNNLSVLSGNAEHQKVHSQLERLSMSLVKTGLILYDKISKEYLLAPQLSNMLSKPGELLGSPNKGNQQRSLREMSPEERSETIQKWSTLKRVEAPGILTNEDDDIVPSL